MDKVKIIPVRIGDVILCSKGFVLIKLVDDNEIGLADVEDMIAASLQLTEGGDYVAMLDGGLTMDISEEAMRYAAKYQSAQWKAFAIVVRTFSERILANYYLKFKKPIRATQVFTNPKRAIEWLGEYHKFEHPKEELMYQPASKELSGK